MNSASLNEISYNLLNTLRGGRSSHSEHLDLDQIKFAIKYYRAMFIRRDLERNHNKFRMFEQDLGHVAVEVIDTAEDDSITSGNTVMKTTNRIPSPIRLKRSEGITHISCPDKVGRPIPLIDAHRSYWEDFNKYTDSSAHASFRDGFVYIFNDITLDTINIRGVFEDPEEVFNFTADNDADIYDPNEPFPISTDMIQGITQGLINGELSLAIRTPNDEELDHMQDSNPKQ